MQNVFTPFGEKDIGSLSGRFHSARLRLTFIYVVILFLVLCISSGSIYSAFSSRLTRRFQRFPPAPGFAYPQGMIPPRAEEVRADLFEAVVTWDGILLIVGGFLSYALAGVTLRPIQSAYERQRRFLADASHELRTPLAILQMGLETELNDSSLSKIQSERSTSHLEEVKRMGRLVGDLLTLSRADEEGGVAISVGKTDVVEIVESVAARFRLIAEARKVSLGVEAPERGSVFASANSDVLTQVLTNIVHNAITYNKEQGTVMMKVVQEGERIRLSVTDTGIGMSPADVEKAFDRFYRADKSRSRATGGSGLGLSIVQSLVVSMNGTVELQSELEKGTTVDVFLPRFISS